MSLLVQYTVWEEDELTNVQKHHMTCQKAMVVTEKKQMWWPPFPVQHRHSEDIAGHTDEGTEMAQPCAFFQLIKLEAHW